MNYVLKLSGMVKVSVYGVISEGAGAESSSLAKADKGVSWIKLIKEFQFLGSS